MLWLVDFSAKLVDFSAKLVKQVFFDYKKSPTFGENFHATDGLCWQSLFNLLPVFNGR